MSNMRRLTIKEVAIRWAEGLETETVLTESTRDDIVFEMEQIPSTDDQELREAVKSILVEMAAEGKLDGDINDLCIDTIFERAEIMLQKGTPEYEEE